MIQWLALNASEVLGILCAAGAIAGMSRWKTAHRPDLLLAFIVFLWATAAREVLVYIVGIQFLTDGAVLASAIGRLGQIVGAVLFLRGIISPDCPAWGKWALLLMVVLFAMVV